MSISITEDWMIILFVVKISLNFFNKYIDKCENNTTRKPSTDKIYMNI